MKVKELIELLKKCPQYYDVIYDNMNQLDNDECHVETNVNKRTDECLWIEYDGQIDELYMEPAAFQLVCLTAKQKESRGSLP